MNESKNKLLPLDGLRGIAAFVVVLHHLRLAFFSAAVDKLGHHLTFLPQPAVRLLQNGLEGLVNGALAVWIFWVLSGFVLSLQFFQRNGESSPEKARDYLKNAALRRYPRLMLPVLVSVLSTWLLLASGGMHNNVAGIQTARAEMRYWLPEWYGFEPNIVTAITSAVWNTFFNFDLHSSYIMVLWTMSFELWGSLGLFALLYVCGHLRRRCVCYFVLAVLVALLHLAWFEAFLAGIILCDLFVNQDRLPSFARARKSRTISFITESRSLAMAGWTGLILLGIYVHQRPVAYSLLAGTCVAFTLTSKPTNRLLGSLIPAFLGKISFGMYLLHVPIIFSFSCWAYLELTAPWGHYPAAILVSLATIVISIAVGWLFHRWIDEPSMKASRWLAGKILRTPERARN